MPQLLVNSQGGLTAAGYAVSVLAVILFIAFIFILLRKRGNSFKMSTQQLVTCGIALALAYVTSYIRIFKLPFGGSVTLFSMLFIVLIGYWYGTRIGVLTGLVFGILQFLQEPYVLSFFQVCCDYFLAFAALGLSGVFKNAKKHGLVKGYTLSVIVRGAFHALGGYLYWMSYMPESFPKSLTAVYPIVYNYSFLLAEGILTVIVISIPAVSKALNQIRGVCAPAVKPASSKSA